VKRQNNAYEEWKVRENLVDFVIRNYHIIFIMNPDKQRAAIAEYCGWKFDKNAYKQWISPNGTSWNYPPAYDKDLNFMFGAEHHLPMDLQDTYMKHLHDITGIEGWGICHALAEVRVEAFLKTIGKWEE